jgi:protein-tyrosine phosphatase
MDTIPARISTRLGADPSGARGQQLTTEMVAAADLLLTMTRGQRDNLVSRHPSAVHRSFTLVEFARLLGHAGGAAERVAPDAIVPTAMSEQLQSVVASAGRKRPSVRLTDDDDVTDPIGRPEDVHEAVGEQISLATSRIVFGLR